MPDSTFAKQLLVKQPLERLRYSMDFTNRIDTGVTISSYEIESTTVGDATSDLVITEDVASGKKILFFIYGGTHATSYTITITVVLSNGETIIGAGMLQVLGS